MSVSNFQKPDRVIICQSSDNFGSFEFRPLEPGYGLTIGNALRRVLLSSLEGFAVTSLRIGDVVHEFSTIDGIVEDVTEIILNLKQIRFKRINDDVDLEEITIPIISQGEFKAGELKKYSVAFEILNPDLVLFNLSQKINSTITLTIEKGRGYVLSDDNKKETDPVGVLAIDSIFTPITNVKYRVEDYRVEQKTDYEKLIIDINTDGSIRPKDALVGAANVLITHFQLFSDEQISIESSEDTKKIIYDDEYLNKRQLLQTKLEDLELSVRAINCLNSANVRTLGDLVSYNKSELMKFRNFGKKSLTELEEVIIAKELSFGMDISKYDLQSSRSQVIA